MGRTAESRATLCPVPAAHSSHLKEITPALPDAHGVKPLLSLYPMPPIFIKRRHGFSLHEQSPER
jgi:hypothetical protein